MIAGEVHAELDSVNEDSRRLFRNCRDAARHCKSRSEIALDLPVGFELGEESFIKLAFCCFIVSNEDFAQELNYLVDMAGEVDLDSVDLF